MTNKNGCYTISKTLIISVFRTIKKEERSTDYEKVVSKMFYRVCTCSVHRSHRGLCLPILPGYISLFDGCGYGIGFPPGSTSSATPTASNTDCVYLYGRHIPPAPFISRRDEGRCQGNRICPIQPICCTLDFLKIATEVSRPLALVSWRLFLPA